MKLEETANISRCLYRFPCEMTSDERLQNWFHTMPLSLVLGSAFIDGTAREICFNHSEALSTQICAVTRHQYEIFKLPSKTLFRKKPAAVASRKVGCFLMFFQYKLFSYFFCFWALKQTKTPESDFFVAVPCKPHNQCCIVWRFSKRLYLICYDRLVSLNDHVTPWSSILFPNTWLYNFETKAKEYRMWCIRDLCRKTLNVTQVSNYNWKWFELFVISRWNNKGNSWSPLWWAAQSWIGESLLTSLFTFFLISIRLNS